MSLEVETRQDAAVVTLSGDAGLVEAAELKRALTPAVLELPELRLEMADVTGVDAAIVQLMHALRCSSRGRGRRVKRVSAVKPEVTQAAADLGAAGRGCGRVCGEAACVFEEQ